MPTVSVAAVLSSFIIVNAPSVINFSYNGITGVSDEEKNLCKNFEICPGSIEFGGHYLVVPYAKQSYSQPSYCQVFYDTVANFRGGTEVGALGRKLETIYVIPVK